MNTININHAFNGFLYAPLFLAEELGYFPKCAKLVYRSGDSACLDRLCEVNGGTEDDWFAICDPFSVPDLATKVHEAGDRISVVGSMINKLPFWLYNSDPNTRKVTSEQQLEGCRPYIHGLSCYKEGTTGYLVGKRLQSRLQISDHDLHVHEFGNEFGEANAPSDSEAVLTSDILRVVYLKDDPTKFIFNYAAFAPIELTPFLFTGILTLRKKVVEDNLWAVLAVLAGLKRAFELLQEKNVRSECVSILCAKYKQHMDAMGVTNAQDQRTLVKNGIIYAFQHMDLANRGLRPQKEAWDKANREWEKTFGPRDVSAVINDDPIPSLLLRRRWRSDPELRKFINEGLVYIPGVVKSGVLRWYHSAALIFSVPIALLALMALLKALSDMQNPVRENFPYIAFSVLAFVAMVASLWQLFDDVLRLDLRRFNLLIGISAGSGLGSFLSALQLIK